VKKVYRYNEYFGRMGRLESVFVATDEDVEELRECGEIYLGEVLGKHSEIWALVNDSTLRELTADSVIVEFIDTELNGVIGVDLIGAAADQMAHEDDEDDDE